MKPSSDLASVFDRRTAFIPFIMAGDPDLATTRALVRALARAGADAIEIGVPFSDPIADGPVNQRAAERALRSGTRLAEILDLSGELRAEEGCPPLVLFTYLNPVLAYGQAISGVDAVLVLDAADDDDEVVGLPNLDRIRLAAPSTTDARLRSIGTRAGSFVYYVSRYGVTGARADLPASLEADVCRVRRLVGRPVAVGFGVSTREQAAAVARIADGVVVGSAIVERIERGGRDSVTEVEAFAGDLAAAVHASGELHRR